MAGINLAEQAHFVNVLPPKDITGGATGQVFRLSGYAHATIIVQVGVSAAAFTKIIVNQANTIGGGAAAAIPYRMYVEETAAGDTLATREAVAAAGRTPSANDNIMYIIEIDAADLAAGFHFVQLSLTNTANAVLASALAILTGGRYVGDLSGTAIT